MLGMSGLKKAWDIILHPGSTSKTMNGIGDALAFYYSAAILPTIAAVIVAAIFGLAVGSFGYSLIGRLLPGAGVAAVLITTLAAIGVALAYLLVLIPVSMIINAAIYQLFAKRIFDIWRKPFKYTMTAVLYGTLPVMMFVWLAFIPVVGSFIPLIFGIWGLIVLIISMARQQGISGARAFGGILLSAVIVSIIVFVITLAVVAVASVALSGLSGHGGVTLSSSCIPVSGFTCTAPALINGNLSVILGQATGTSWASQSFAFVPTSYSVNSSTFYVVPGGMQSGAITTVNLPVPASAASGSSLSGTIYARYSLTTGQAVPYLVKVATVSITKT